MKRNFSALFSVILIVAGVCTFLYPDVTSWMQDRYSAQIIAEFESLYEVQDTNEANSSLSVNEENTESNTPISEEDPGAQEREEISERPYKELYDAISEYNHQIYESKQCDFADAWCYTQSPVDVDCLESELFGYIEIPVMKIKLPLYIGASNSNMAKGAAVMGQTSIPVGGTNTNSVIAGHRGYGGTPMFKEIENVKLGDYVYVTNPWETLTYQAVEISVINPNDTETVKIQEGRDMITLLTCHPYRSGGKYRYLVYCERVVDDATEIESSPENNEEKFEETKPGQENVTSPTIQENNPAYESSADIIRNEIIMRRIGAVAIVVIIGLTMISNRKKGKNE